MFEGKLSSFVLIVFVICATLLRAQNLPANDAAAKSVAAAPATPAPHGTFVLAYRTPRHISYSTPEVFHGITKTVLDFLGDNHVPVVRDSERGTIETAEVFSTDTMVRLAREAGAADLLYVTVDRPLSKWVKITIQCYDLSGKQLWQEQASNGGGFSGKGGLKATTDKLTVQLRARAGQPCVAADTVSPANTATP